MRHILITGGGNGIGLAIAKTCLMMGDCVSIVDYDISIGSSFNHPNLFLLQANVSHELDVCNAVMKAVERFGKLDIVIHGACLCDYSFVKDMSVETVKSILETNFIGGWLVMRYASDCLSSNSHVWFFSSGVGVTGLAGLSAYASSKGAIESLVKCLRLEYPFHIGVIHPPLTKTKAASCFPIPDAFKQDASLVGEKLAYRLEKNTYVLTIDLKQKILLSICYLFPLFIGKWLNRLTMRAMIH